MLLRQLNFGVLLVNSYLMFFTKEKFDFSDMAVRLHFKNGYPRQFVLMFFWTVNLALFLACSYFFAKIMAFFLTQSFL